MPITKRKRLKIAQLAPLIERVPPKKYGGTERMVYHLTEELVRRGHDVTLFASGDSLSSGKIVSVYPRSLREAKIPNVYGLNSLTLLNIGTAYKRQGEFDVIHDHSGIHSLPTANTARKPVVMTLHGPFTVDDRRLFSVLRRPNLVTISKSQARLVTTMNHMGTVHNGLPMENYPFSAGHDGYLLFVGRLSMEKGPHIAIEVAQYLDLPLILAAKLDPIDLQYFREYISPKLSDERVKWVGEVDEETRNRLMSRAMCVLHPITWSEPFGLTVIESMACGAPVIAFNRGSIPELVINGKTGFIVDNVQEMIDSVSRLRNIRRLECRRHSLENFSAKKMAYLYERFYYKLIT